MIDLVSLGEMMLRLSPPKHERLRRAAALDVRACGAQFNLAANFAALGKHSLFLSQLPDNELGHLARSLGQSYGVDMSQVQLGDTPKIGLVFVEFSLAPRRQVHLYDRQGSAASRISPADFAWSEILQGAHFAHTDGIFPALGAGPRQAALAFLKAARECGCTASFDVNFRESLWPPDDALALYRQALLLKAAGWAARRTANTSATMVRTYGSMTAKSEGMLMALICSQT